MEEAHLCKKNSLINNVTPEKCMPFPNASLLEENESLARIYVLLQRGVGH